MVFFFGKYLIYFLFGVFKFMVDFWRYEGFFFNMSGVMYDFIFLMNEEKNFSCELSSSFLLDFIILFYDDDIFLNIIFVFFRYFLYVYEMEIVCLGLINLLLV